MAKNKLAIFDIDGTIFRSSLLIELNWMLMKEGVFPKAVKQELDDSYFKWIDRKGSYEDYINDVIEVYNKRVVGKKVADVKRIARKVVDAQKDRVYVYTRDLIKKIRRDHTLVAISGSPLVIVTAFNKYYNFDFLMATTRVVKDGKFTSEFEDIPAQDKKEHILSFCTEEGYSLRGSIGLGDTEADIGFLELVDRPICFNPNMNLYKKAKREAWQVVVERKDVIYKI